MDFDFSWLSNLMGGAGATQGTSALGGLGSMGDFSSVTAPAAQAAATDAGVGNNPFGFSQQSGGLGTNLDPKMLQSIMSQANAGSAAGRSGTGLGGGGVAPRGGQVQINQPAAATPLAARMGLRQIIGG